MPSSLTLCSSVLLRVAPSELMRAHTSLSCVLTLLALAASATKSVSICGQEKTLDLGALGDGEYFTLYSHKDADRRKKYSKKHRCTLTMKKPKSCKAAEISCDSFDVRGSGKCSRGDYLQISRKKYCGKSGPRGLKVTSSRTTISFKANGDSQTGGGFACKVKCQGGRKKPGAGSSGGGNSNGCKCGQIKSRTRIVGGQTAMLHEFPWQVALLYRQGSSRPSCGGTLISESWIVSAAHCVQGGFKPVNAALGEHDTSTKRETQTLIVPISQIKSHRSYDSKRIDYDYSVLKLSKPVDLKANAARIAPACLPSRAVTDGEKAVVSGWGTTSQGGSQPSRLQKARVDLVPYPACNKYFPRNQISARMVCAGVKNGIGGIKPGIDACQGDSGGPLVAERSNKFELVGIVSWGMGCANGRSPGVYANAFEVKSWICQQTGVCKNSCPP